MERLQLEVSGHVVKMLVSGVVLVRQVEDICCEQSATVSSYGVDNVLPHA